MLSFARNVCLYFILNGISIYRFCLYRFLLFFTPQLEKYFKKTFKSIGVEINGNKPYDIKVKDKRYYAKVAAYAGIGSAETYIDGWKECERYDELFTKVLRSDLYQTLVMNPVDRFLNWLEFELFNMQAKDRAYQVGKQHFDVGNDLYEAMLGPTMQYTCAYWRDAANLEEAQIAKMEMIAQKLKLKPGMRVLDLGCGWGSLAKYLAENHGVQVVGVTIGKEGAKYAREKCKGLPVEIRVMDYRDVNEKFDRVTAIGILEHIGKQNYREFYQVANRCLVDDGIMVTQNIGTNESKMFRSEPYASRHVFVNGRIPYYKELCDGFEDIFVIEDWMNMGADYDKTLMVWWANFEKAWATEPKWKAQYGDNFYMGWRLYLQYSAGFFRSRKFHLWQMVLTKKGLMGGYYAPR